MKYFLTSLLTILIIAKTIYSQTAIEKIYIANWNAENLFDTIDDPSTKDEEWLPESEKKWTDERLEKKIKNLSKVIRYMNDMDAPDIIGFEEVEHQHLLDSLITKHFCDKKYKSVYEESPDNRGIDNGLIYDSEKFALIKKEAYEVTLPDNYPTRLILYAGLQLFDLDTIHVFVNHWPSRRGGDVKSEKNRIAAASTLLTNIKRLQQEYKNPKIVVVGDFNDEPNNTSINSVLNAKSYDCQVDQKNISANQLYNLSSEIFNLGSGTYMYKSEWNMLDQIIVSGSLLIGDRVTYICDSFEIVKPEILITKTGPYEGASIPTFGGRFYLGGFSDHFPVGASFIIWKGKNAE